MPDVKPPDDRSAMALAMAWSSRITTVSVEMVLPALLGYWFDQWLGTEPLFLMLGAALGLTGGIWHLIRMTTPTSAQTPRRSPKDNGKPH